MDQLKTNLKELRVEARDIANYLCNFDVRYGSKPADKKDEVFRFFASEGTRLDQDIKRTEHEINILDQDHVSKLKPIERMDELKKKLEELTTEAIGAANYLNNFDVQYGSKPADLKDYSYGALVKSFYWLDEEIKKIKDEINSLELPVKSGSQWVIEDLDNYKIES